MALMNPRGTRRGAQMPKLPSGEIVSTYDSYADAVAAVDKLAQADFPVRAVSVVGNGVKSIETVTGKLTYGRVALSGALSGGYLGLFVGLLLILFQPGRNLFGFFFVPVC